MDEKLNEIYQSMLTESDMTVGNVKPGELDGAKKNAKPIKQKATGDNTVETPEEGPSSDEVKKGGATKNAEKAGKVDTHESSKFDSLFKSIVSEADMGEEKDDTIVNAPEIEGDEFSDELGDFESSEETDVESETSVAAELRLMADRLSELADKMGVDLEDEGEDMGEGEGEGMGEGMGEGEGKEEAPVAESMKSQPEPKPAKKTTFGPKMSKTVGKLSKVSGKHAKGGIKGSYTGEPQKAKATQFGPKMSLKAKASGPASKANSEAF